jgi:hypothetical protein
MNQFTLNNEALIAAGAILTGQCFGLALASGWHTDLATGERKKHNVGERLCLVHSEISEAMEGARKNRMDDHLPHRKQLEVELADAVIRIFDMGGEMNLDLGGAIAEKLAYNANRSDHKIENRLLADGKKF